MEPPATSPYYEINDTNFFFSAGYCRYIEQADKVGERNNLLEAAAGQIGVSSKFIEEHNAKVAKLIEELPKDDSMDNILKHYALQKAITHLTQWDERFNAVVNQALGLQKKIVEANDDNKTTEEKCTTLFEELVTLKENCEKLEDEVYAHMLHQRKHVLISVSFNPQEEKMPEINPENGVQNPQLECALSGLGESIAIINIASSNVFYGSLAGIKANAPKL